MLKDKVPWFYCFKNEVWHRRVCKHSACHRRHAGDMPGDNGTRVAYQSPGLEGDRPV